MKNLWQALVAIRLFLTLIPQSGYIHPDEFFQSPEITAGSVFGFETHKTWEWLSQDLPLRNVIFPYATSGSAFLLLKKLQDFFPKIVTAYTLLVYPRVFMTALSLFLDFLMYKLCRHLRIDAERCLIFLASSYVTMVFCCRTFSNGTECILYALVMLLTLKSAGSMGKAKGRTGGGRNQTYAFLLSVIITYGIFMRLTFVAFVMWPMFYWYYSIVRHHGFIFGFSSAFSLIPGAVATAFVCIVTDSIYYGTLNSDVIFSFDLDYFYKTFTSEHIHRNLTLTPLNFLLYNSDMSKLSDHPIHPRITNFALNMPLLFLPLLLWVIPALFSFDRTRQQLNKTSLVDRVNLFLILAIIVPVGVLSVIPHQEPRYIIPVMVPLILLFCKNVTDLSFNFKISWIVWNILGVLFFGFYHQGGVIPCMRYLHDVAKSNPQTQHYFVFYHTYMPPQHLLGVGQRDHVTGPSANQDAPFSHVTTHEDAPFSHVTTHDLGGADQAVLSQKIDRLMTYADLGHRDDTVVYVISPSTLHPYFCAKHAQYNFKLQRQFFFHITIEDPMDFSFDDEFAVDKNAGTVMKFIHSELSLNLYKVVRHS